MGINLAKIVGHSDLILREVTCSDKIHALVNFDISQAYRSVDIILTLEMVDVSFASCQILPAMATFAASLNEMGAKQGK